MEEEAAVGARGVGSRRLYECNTIAREAFLGNIGV